MRPAIVKPAGDAPRAPCYPALPFLTHVPTTSRGAAPPVTRPPERRFFTLFMRFWLPLLVYVTAIFAASAQPNLHAPLQFQFGDKVMHTVEYLVLGLLLVRALRAHLRVGRPLFATMIALGFVVLIGSADEYFQSFVPGRTCDVFDLLADGVGGAIAQFVYLTFARH
jgi:VanZ family protein